MLEPLSTSVLIKHGFMAFFGGIVHALTEHRQGTSKTFTDFLILTIISSFSGILFGFIALKFFPDNEYISLAMAGSGGFMGLEGLKLISKVIVKILKTSIEELK